MTATVTTIYPRETANHVDAFTVLGNPEDPRSLWRGLRFAELAGYDYIFFKREVFTRINREMALEAVILDLCALNSSKVQRAKIIVCDTDKETKEFNFSELHMVWRGGQLIQSTELKLKTVDQSEFINTVYDHSGLLTGTS